MIARRAAWACLVALPALSSAAQWEVMPRVALGIDADSNRRLRIVPRASEGGVLSGALTLARLTETSSFALMPRYSVSRYSGDDALDSEDWGIDTGWRRSGLRTQFDAHAGYADENTLATELGETGFVDGNTRRHAATASVALVHYLAPRHTLRYELAYNDIDYLQKIGTGLVGYRYPAANLSYGYVLSPRLEATLTANRARLTVHEFPMESDTGGFQAGLRFRYSENFNIEARTGATQTRSRGASDTERSYFLGIDWSNELSRFSFSASRDVAPSGHGVLVNADDLDVSYSRRLGEHLSIDTSLHGSRRADFTFDRRPNDYQYLAAAVGLSYQFDESWTVVCAGGYARQSYEIPPDVSEGKRIGLRITWQPPQP